MILVTNIRLYLLKELYFIFLFG